MRRWNLSPSQLIAGCILGYALACTGFALLGSHSFVHTVGFFPLLLVSLGIMASGGLLLLKAQGALGEGVRQERWSQEELRGPRRFTEHRAVRVLELLALTMAVALVVVELATKRHNVNIFCWPLIYVSMLFQGIRSTLKEPRISQTPMQFESLASLRSQHWGRDSAST